MRMPTVWLWSSPRVTELTTLPSHVAVLGDPTMPPKNLYAQFIDVNQWDRPPLLELPSHSRCAVRVADVTAAQAQKPCSKPKGGRAYAPPSNVHLPPPPGLGLAMHLSAAVVPAPVTPPLAAFAGTYPRDCPRPQTAISFILLLIRLDSESNDGGVDMLQDYKGIIT